MQLVKTIPNNTTCSQEVLAKAFHSLNYATSLWNHAQHQLLTVCCNLHCTVMTFQGFSNNEHWRSVALQGISSLWKKWPAGSQLERPDPDPKLSRLGMRISFQYYESQPSCGMHRQYFSAIYTLFIADSEVLNLSCRHLSLYITYYIITHFLILANLLKLRL